ncbi:dockerin type I domain-containing protein [Chloroflexota bacterium]
MRWVGRVVLVVALIVITAFVGVTLVRAQPSEVWVDDSWSGSNPGDPVDGHTFAANAFVTIQEGINAVASPGTVHVAAGTYYENITLKDGVEVLGAGADVTTVDGGGSGSVVIAVDVGSAVKLDGFTITNGSADYGGGIQCSFLTIISCTIVNNSASNGGGGIWFNYASPTIINCIISGNNANAGGGIGFEGDSSTPYMSNNIISQNNADWGGGIYSGWQSSPTITNNTIIGNDSSLGGGIRLIASYPIISNNIIASNLADADGGGIHCDNLSSPTIGYNDVWGNINRWSNTSGDYYGCVAGQNDISQDPTFVNSSAGDYHLKPNSPCIDAGDNNAATTAGLTTDFEDSLRIIDGDDDSSAVVDMGADEYVPLIPGDATGDGQVNAQDITSVERIIAGLDTITLGADANQDGVVNALDITKTEMLVAGLD